MIKDLYIHIPFCQKKCSYCDFYSIGNNYTPDLQKTYIKTLIMEIDSYRELINDKLKTVYLGGGTPSILSTSTILPLLKKLSKYCNDDTEFTIEINPGTISSDKIKTYKEYGINRYSLGIQSFADKYLKFLGRTYTSKDIHKSLEIFQKNKINNFNIDIMTGICDQNKYDIDRDISFIKTYKPPHVSAYILTYYPKTKLYLKWKNGQVDKISDEKVIYLYNYFSSQLENCDLQRYEISNYARKGFISKHNMNTWKTGSYLGIGAGAHSAYKNIRQSNLTDVNKYIKNIYNSSSIVQKEELNSFEIMNEYIMLHLRLREGLNLINFFHNFHIDLYELKRKTIQKLISNKLIKLSTDNIKLTKNGFNIYDSIVLELFVE